MQGDEDISHAPNHRFGKLVKQASQQMLTVNELTF